jgi:putative heme-binding domain-containing protein
LWLAKEKGSSLLTFEPPPGDFSVPPSVKITAAFKPSVVRYTLDGTRPTARSPAVERTIQLKSAATVRAAIFVDGKQVGSAAEAVYRQAKPDAEPPATGLAAVKPLEKQTTVAEAMPLVGTGDAARGRAIFFARGGAGCFNCHRVGERGILYGPELTGIGGRNDPAGLVQSILEPNAQIVEGFGTQLVTTKDGDDYMGILREETDTALTLVQGGGGTVRIDKASIAERRPLHSSSMPDYSQSLTPQQVADLVAWLTSQK